MVILPVSMTYALIALCASCMSAGAQLISSSASAYDIAHHNMDFLNKTLLLCHLCLISLYIIRLTDLEDKITV